MTSRAKLGLSGYAVAITNRKFVFSFYLSIEISILHRLKFYPFSPASIGECPTGYLHRVVFPKSYMPFIPNSAPVITYEIRLIETPNSGNRLQIEPGRQLGHIDLIMH